MCAYILTLYLLALTAGDLVDMHRKREGKARDDYSSSIPGSDYGSR